MISRGVSSGRASFSLITYMPIWTLMEISTILIRILRKINICGTKLSAAYIQTTAVIVSVLWVNETLAIHLFRISAIIFVFFSAS